MRRPIKCVLIGNSDVGKSCLLDAYVNKIFMELPQFPCGHHLTRATTSNGRIKDLLICDCLGSRDDEQVNRLCYPDADVFIICFSVEKPKDLPDVRWRWLSEVRNYGANSAVPIILVATKMDLHDFLFRGTVTSRQGMEMAKEIGALEYISCSARRGVGVTAVFDTALTCGLHYRCLHSIGHKKKKKLFCSLM